jgi:hypothetical protein
MDGLGGSGGEPGIHLGLDVLDQPRVSVVGGHLVTSGS